MYEDMSTMKISKLLLGSAAALLTVPAHAITLASVHIMITPFDLSSMLTLGLLASLAATMAFRLHKNKSD